MRSAESPQTLQAHSGHQRTAIAGLSVYTGILSLPFIQLSHFSQHLAPICGPLKPESHTQRVNRVWTLQASIGCRQRRLQPLMQ